MTKWLFALIILAFPALSPFSAAAQNPFVSKGPSQDTAQISKSAPGYPFLDKISEWQRRLNLKIAALTRKAKENGSTEPLLLLLGLAFAYGVLHAAGPGHGKAVTASYLLSHKSKLSRGILLGNMAAFFHGVSGVLLVLIVHTVLIKGISGSLEHVTRVTQLISYALIATLGLVLLTRNILSWSHMNPDEQAHDAGRFHSKKMGYISMALAVGVVPCPGVVLIMLFCLSLNEIGLGLLLALSLILGMAFTISFVGIFGIAGKKCALRALSPRPRLSLIIEKGIETAAALMITALGMLFFAAVICR
jgi:ABC-type nickel/cobalt efflux system permease component RcnA